MATAAIAAVAKNRRASQIKAADAELYSPTRLGDAKISPGGDESEGVEPTSLEEEFGKYNKYTGERRAPFILLLL